MKRAIDGEQTAIEDDMPTEIDFSKATRGRFTERVSQGATMVLLEPDVAEVFSDSEAVNAALRMVLRAGVVAAGEAIQERHSSK